MIYLLIFLTPSVLLVLFFCIPLICEWLWPKMPQYYLTDLGVGIQFKVLKLDEDEDPFAQFIRQSGRAQKFKLKNVQQMKLRPGRCYSVITGYNDKGRALVEI